MPPIMGAAAFLMAEFVGIPYVRVVEAAVIPALLYFTGVMLCVHFEARKEGLRGMSREELPKIGRVLREKGHLAIPLIAVIWLLVSGKTPCGLLYGLCTGHSFHVKIFHISWRDMFRVGRRLPLSPGGNYSLCHGSIIIGVVTKPVGT